MVFASHAAVGQGQAEVLSYGGCVIGAVVFDVGECLVDESREYGTWADWLGVPRHVFSAVFGAIIARGQDYRETFEVFQPGFDLDKARQQRAGEANPEWFGEDDLYPDARPALARLRADGFWVGIAGNQTSRAGRILRSLGLSADMIATSDDWGVAKPDTAFFRRLIHAVPFDPASILYVGDRLDNDIVPASAVGLRTALIKRGPWAWIQRDDPAGRRVPDMRVDSLAELPGRIAAFNAGAC
jgi:HAD superfamily hydrolase (TIGR01549 family)